MWVLVGVAHSVYHVYGHLLVIKGIFMLNKNAIIVHYCFVLQDDTYTRILTENTFVTSLGALLAFIS